MALGASALAASGADGQAEAADATMRRAASAERAGRTNEAVSAYVSLLARDTACEAVVAPRLVSLYAGSGDSAQALAWAARAARGQPCPKAYLAGVYALIGQLAEAEFLLRDALRDERDPYRRTPLLWQLAEVQERQGRNEAARATLDLAHDASNDERLRQTTEQRLAALANRMDASRPPCSKDQPTAEDKP